MSTRRTEGTSSMPHTNGVVRSVAPSGVTVTDGEAALARLLRIGSTPTPDPGALAGWAMLVAMLGALIALAALALGA
jgi:hypothetical protein